MENPQDEDFWLEQFGKAFDKQPFFKQEREKTESEAGIICGINEKMKDFVERYGGKHVDISKKNVHIADPKKFSKENWNYWKNMFGGKSGAVYSIGMQGIHTVLFRQEDDVDFAKVLTHELIHMNGFQSVKAGWTGDSKDEANIYSRRMGMAAYGSYGKDEPYVDVYFNRLEEAVTEELACRFADEYFPHFSELTEGLNLRKNFFEEGDGEGRHIADVSVRSRQKRDGLWMTKISESKKYPKERKYLQDLVDTIYQKNKEQFASREEVFSEFARMHFTGKMLPLARLIEKTMGKGYFRRIGEETKILERKDKAIF